MNTVKNFKDLDLAPEIISNLELLGFTSMTEIQQQALPDILNGKDVIAQAQTGSGKTVAFGLRVIESCDTERPYVQSLILCPTRELATQVATEVRKLGRLCENLKVLILSGGTPFGPQKDSLARGAHIVVGTPGRILDHLQKKTLTLSKVRTLVLDEADRMLDMGFQDDIRAIINRVGKVRQTLLFSATYPENIEDLSRDIQKSPIRVTAQSSVGNTDIEQKFIEVRRESKNEALLSLMAEYKPESSVVFCTTKVQCDEVAQFLRKSGLVALAMHGDIEQYDRDEIMVRFANKSISVLVATDVAARGLDVKDLSAVFNYEVSKDPEVHVHRIGRTGRAGNKGLAVSLYSTKESFRVTAVETYMKTRFKRTSFKDGAGLKVLSLKPDMKTLQISAGKKNKLRAGDILGALTKDAGIEGHFIGKINIFDFTSYVAVHQRHAQNAIRRLENSKIKNRTFKMRLIP